MAKKDFSKRLQRRWDQKVKIRALRKQRAMQEFEKMLGHISVILPR